MQTITAAGQRHRKNADRCECQRELAFILSSEFWMQHANDVKWRKPSLHTTGNEPQNCPFERFRILFADIVLFPLLTIREHRIYSASSAIRESTISTGLTRMPTGPNAKLRTQTNQFFAFCMNGISYRSALPACIQVTYARCNVNTIIILPSHIDHPGRWACETRNWDDISLEWKFRAK